MICGGWSGDPHLLSLISEGSGLPIPCWPHTPSVLGRPTHASVSLVTVLTGVETEVSPGHRTGLSLEQACWLAPATATTSGGPGLSTKHHRRHRRVVDERRPRSTWPSPWRVSQLWAGRAVRSGGQRRASPGRQDEMGSLRRLQQAGCLLRVCRAGAPGMPSGEM